MTDCHDRTFSPEGAWPPASKIIAKCSPHTGRSEYWRAPRRSWMILSAALHEGTILRLSRQYNNTTAQPTCQHRNWPDLILLLTRGKEKARLLGQPGRYGRRVDDGGRTRNRRFHRPALCH